MWRCVGGSQRPPRWQRATRALADECWTRSSHRHAVARTSILPPSIPPSLDVPPCLPAWSGCAEELSSVGFGWRNGRLSDADPLAHSAHAHAHDGRWGAFRGDARYPIASVEVRQLRWGLPTIRCLLLPTAAQWHPRPFRPPATVTADRDDADPGFLCIAAPRGLLPVGFCNQLLQQFHSRSHIHRDREA